MGIPKFFRYVSERYPLTSQLVEDNRIPEFDCLYLDMNGIIHACAANTGEGSVRKVNETDMVQNIFKYIEHLFSKIRPRKTFFMAVDGVAPRAKMNQQRSRRFRSAQEHAENLAKAQRMGENIDEAFNSNCITPGTTFMAKLSKQLKYFVHKKITEDALWHGVDVILSGHEVPGEGEHKIQEFIRLTKAQPNYNPNMRHCLYGLDADLIMLGLLSHEPHFCLLREEVTFGPQKKKKSEGLEHQKFYLMHLSLFREYLDLEFKDIRLTLPFDYDLERIIDDFILLAILVGNDFLPHLPGFHINDGALELLFSSYKKILQEAGGYINELGNINFNRLQLVMNYLHEFERTVFKDELVDMDMSSGPVGKYTPLVLQEGNTTMTSKQAKLHETLTENITSGPLSQKGGFMEMSLPLAESEREYLHAISEKFNLVVEYDHFASDGVPKAIVRAPVSDARREGLSAAQRIGMALDDNSSDSEIEDDLNNPDALEDEMDNLQVSGFSAKFMRSLAALNPRKVINDPEDAYEEQENAIDRSFEGRFKEWKEEYYSTKLGFSKAAQPEQVRKLVQRYVEGIQWVIKYYYEGCVSWGWFYDYYYAPKISDIVDMGDIKCDFEKGIPFKPFEQLMGVLPSASKELVPLVYRDLMTEESSPIIKFYPEKFEKDMNGKKQEWEAIIKIPFIEEQLLLNTMKRVEQALTPEERLRNSFGDATIFKYDANRKDQKYESTHEKFTTIANDKCVESVYTLPELGEDGFRQGLVPHARSGKYALAGFPTLYNIQFESLLHKHGVMVFNQPSRKDSIVIVTFNRFENHTAEDVAKSLLGKRVFINWPFLQEALVVGISDQDVKFALEGNNIKEESNSPIKFARDSDRLETAYSKSRAVRIGVVDIIVHALPLKGLKRKLTGELVKDYEGKEKEQQYPLQTTVLEVESEDQRYLEQAAPPLEEEFSVGTQLFFLGVKYGSPATVVAADSESNTMSLRLVLMPNLTERPKFNAIGKAANSERYYISPKVAQYHHIQSLTLSKIASALTVVAPDGKSVNIGLNLKFEAKGEKVAGYTQKNQVGWEYSDKASDLVGDYKFEFPELFVHLDRNKNLNNYSEIWSDRSEGAERLAEIQKWLKAKKVNQFETVSLFVNQMSSETIVEVEKLSGELAEASKKLEPKKAIVKGVPRHAVLKPNHAATRIINQQFRLCDRVVYVADHGKVNLTSRGTVVGISSNNLIDVVMDEPFMSGTTLGGKCSAYRGATIPSYSVLNLSNEQFVASMDGMAENAQYENPPAPFKRQIGPRPALGGDRHVHQAMSAPQERSSPGPKSGYSGAHKGRHMQQQPPSHQQNLANALSIGGAGKQPKFINRPLPPHQQMQQPQNSSFRPRPPPVNYNSPVTYSGQAVDRPPPPHMGNPAISNRPPPPHLLNQQQPHPTSLQFGDHSIPITHASDNHSGGNGRGGQRGRGRGRGGYRGRGSH